MRRLVALGSESQHNADVRDALAQFTRGTSYQRLMAVQACHGSRDGEYVLRSVSDPSRAVRSLALSALAIICDDDQALQALSLVKMRAQLKLIDALTKRKRQSIVDRFVESLTEGDPALYAKLLPYASADLVRRTLSMLTQYANTNLWRSLTRRHPQLAADALGTEAERAESDNRVRLLTEAILPILSKRLPNTALALLRVLKLPVSIGQLRILFIQHANELVDLRLADHPALSGWTPSSRYKLSPKNMARLSMDRVLRLLERGLLGTPSVQQLRALAPDQRGQWYVAYGLGWRSTEGIIASQLIALLPRAEREAEARRHWALPVLPTRTLLRLVYATFLPWTEADEKLTPFLHSADPKVRTAALSALIGAVQYQRAHLPDVLNLIRARRNEQDPIRQAMFTALAELQPSMWRAEHLPEVSQIMQDALNAADLSSSTVVAIQTLVMRLLPYYVAWSVEWLATFVRDRGTFHYGTQLIEHIPYSARPLIAAALQPVLEAWEQRDRKWFIITTAQVFAHHKRLDDFYGLRLILERLTHQGESPRISEAALSVLWETSRGRTGQLIQTLLKEDPSWITQPIVHRCLHRYRQDLLTPFLGLSAYSGRFATGKTRFVLPVSSGFERWTPHQQRIFAGVLTELTKDSKRDTPALRDAVTQLSRLTWIDPARVIALANSDARPAIRDRAVQALAWSDAGQGIPTLLDAMADDRARIAIYALRRILLNMPADQALHVLQGLPLEKVTVAKEIVRLIGELHSDAAYHVLLGFNTRDVHRDVRMALMRALSDYPDHAETWAIFRMTATSDNPFIATSVGRIPTEQLTHKAQTELIGVIGLLLHHPDPAVRIDVLGRCADLPIADTERRLIELFLQAIESALPDESQAGARAVFSTYGGRDPELIGRAVRNLQKNRRGLSILLNTLDAALVRDPQGLQAALRRVLDVLDGDVTADVYQAKLAVHGLPMNELIPYFMMRGEQGRLHAGVLNEIIPQLPRIDRVTLGSLESALRDAPDAALRFIALHALLLIARSAQGWTDALRGQLEQYRMDPNPLVASAAQFVFPPIA